MLSFSTGVPRMALSKIADAIGGKSEIRVVCACWLGLGRMRCEEIEEGGTGGKSTKNKIRRSESWSVGVLSHSPVCSGWGKESSVLLIAK